MIAQEAFHQIGDCGRCEAFETLRDEGKVGYLRTFPYTVACGQAAIENGRLTGLIAYYILAEMEMAADLEHVTDIAEIGSYGVMGTPALVINREVKAVGLAAYISTVGAQTARIALIAAGSGARP